MARGGRVIYKKSNQGRRRKLGFEEDDDDGDEEYVVEEEEEEEESSYESDAPSSGEASFKFSDEEEEDEEETKISRSRGNRKKSRVSDDGREGLPAAKKGRPRSWNRQEDGDSDYEMEEEERDLPRARGICKNFRVSDDEMEDVPVMNKGKPRSKREARDSDYEMEDEDEDENFSLDEDDWEEDEVLPAPRKRGAKNLEKKAKSRVLRPKGRKKQKAVGLQVRKRLRESALSSDDDFVVKDRVSVGRGKKGRKKLGRRMAAKAAKTNCRKKRLAVDSESLESDFVTSDDDFVLEEDQIMVNRTKSGDKAKKMAGSRGRRKKSSDLESGSSDSDYVISDEDELIERDQVLVRKDKMKQQARSKTRRKMSSVHSKSSDADYKILEDDDFVVKDRVSVGRRKELGRGMAAKAAKTNSRKKRLAVDSESLESDFVTSDDDFVLEEDQVMVNGTKSSDKAKKTAGSRGRRKKNSDLESESSDSDYVISDKDELIGRDQVLVHKQREDKMKQQERSKMRRKMSSAHSKSSDADYKVLEDDYFTTREEILVDKKKEKMKEAGSKTRRKRFSVESESSDSDYIISEGEDFMVENKLAVVKQQKNKKEGKRKTEPSTRRKRSSVVSNSSDNNDDLNFEEEVRDLRLGGGLNQQHQLGQQVVSKHKEEKGKEKEASELGKQVCGICLSEEQKGVVQGLLNCCSHYFCFACIMEWSKVESRCPVCKRRFVTITKSGRSDPGFGMRKAVIRVEKRDQVYHPSEEELRDMLDPYENVVCIECQQGGDDNLMLLCDICDSSSHTYCVGLGREVPEGNWYCGGCKSTSDGQMLSQAQDNMTDQETGGNCVFVGVAERGGFTNVRLATNSPQPVSLPSQTSTLRIDLNASPRDFSGEDHYASSPIYGSGASTLSGRRHIQQRIQQRIRILLSNSRPRQNFTGINMHSSETDAITSEGALVEDTLHASRGVLEHQQDCRPAFRSNATLVPCMLKEGSSFRHVDGAKEQIQSMVLSYLQKYSRDTPLERTTFKEVGRKSTHTILAACGIEHRRDMVSADVEPPNDCAHDTADGPAHLAKGCCSSCFNSFVKDVVLRLVNF